MLLRETIRNLRLLAVFAITSRVDGTGRHWRESFLDFFKGGGKSHRLRKL